VQLPPSRQLGEEINNLDADYVLNASESDLVAALVSKYTLDVPVLYEDAIHIHSDGERQIDVSWDPGRDIRGAVPSGCLGSGGHALGSGRRQLLDEANPRTRRKFVTRDDTVEDFARVGIDARHAERSPAFAKLEARQRDSTVGQ